MAKIILTLFIITVVILLAVLGHLSRSGKAPGMVDGKLQRCSDKANCVSSEYKEDSEHYIKPITLPENASVDSLQILQETIKGLGGVIETENKSYIAATFSSAVFGFVDDLEIRLDSEKNSIHFRASSRVGYSDLGVNKKRVALIKDLFLQKVKNS